ncbi:LysR family transcriptional regulator [Tamaricihabitans halophyticus]|uniref:LysR family transcriptional regulator n=1 Tax=Tamaricihabitans halophyticus TaxID=1262583 RepID=A0A4R2QXT4_9PSEU|nr:LysR family transcriptional regulator [Tamaricihabitans halophyticus]TCP55020.1 LysR family transcriptional regulator [Tamaricihabitans halophyticus]
MEWTSSQLRSLVELTRRGTITAVAETLGYTPGGVSQQLAALERSVREPLLRRVGRRVELTDAGRALARHAERMLSIEADAVAALERTTRTVAGSLNIGVFATAAAEILPIALTRAREKHPELAVQSREMVVDEVYDAVAAGSVDLALGLDYPDVPIPRAPSLRLVRLVRERFALAVPSGVLPDRQEISVADTGDLGWILPDLDTHYGRAIRTVCRRAGVEPDVRHQVTDTAASLALVEAGVGTTPVTDLMLRLRPSQLRVLDLTERFERDIVIIVRSAAQSRPTVAALAGVLHELTATGE